MSGDRLNDEVQAINDALQFLERWMDIERIHEPHVRERLRRAYAALQAIEAALARLDSEEGK